VGGGEWQRGRISSTRMILGKLRNANTHIHARTAKGAAIDLVIVGRDKLCACGERHAHYQTTIMRVHAASESHNIKWGSSSRTPL